MNNKRPIVWLILTLMVLGLSLTGCHTPGGDAPTETVPVVETDDLALLVGVWENQGQYDEDRDFVETLTLYPDGTAAVHLVYQGEDYADLAGSYLVAGGAISVTLQQSPDSDPVTRIYYYQVDQTSLTLQGQGKEAFYTRIG